MAFIISHTFPLPLRIIALQSNEQIQINYCLLNH